MTACLKNNCGSIFVIGEMKIFQYGSKEEKR